MSQPEDRPTKSAGEYSPREVADLLGLSLAEVRRCVREGFLTARPSPGGAPRLTFQDVVLLREAARLVSARVAPHRVRRAFRELRRQLPIEQPLSGVRLCAEGNAVIALERDLRWNPLSGQLLLDFSPRTEGVARSVSLPASRAARAEAERLYEEACELEEAGPTEAMAAYRRAVALAPSHAQARINLGRLLHAEGRLHEAEAEYRAALAVEPREATAWFNLGVLLEDLHRLPDAVRAYEEALRADGDAADAHFNLARLLEKRGDRAGALRHLKAYRRLTARG